ncbi:MAG TPA: class I SAM-dependent methyltransferase [Acidimicrobiales bacterium]|nr:class I SAM-dependent methyltransferase [Acidimicrobiales bacterium]
MDDVEVPSGERFVPEAMGGQLIEAEHHARYRHAAQLVGGRWVLDAGCGVGWGSALLAAAGAASVTGLDIDPDALSNARARTDAAVFVRGDLADLPFADASFDVVVCYEAIEHVAQPLLALDELRRVLTPAGVLTISSPNPDVYPAGNPFHVHEFTPDELRRELSHRFPNIAAFQQHTMLASVVVPEAHDPDASCATTTLADLTITAAAYSVFDASGVAPCPVAAQAVLVSGQQFTGLVALAETYRTALDAGGDPGAESDGAVADRLLRLERDHYRAELDQALLLLLDAEQELARRQREPTT